MAGENDALAHGNGQFDAAWNWKGAYVNGLGTSDGKEFGLEKFSQLSASPDSTAMFAGPCRFTGIKGAASLIPIGMADGISLSTNAQLARLFEIGSNRSFFTRGKTISNVGFSRMLADTPSLLKVMTQQSRALFQETGLQVYDKGFSAAGAPDSNVFLNLDSELMAIPFGIMLMFKTRGGSSATRGRILTAVYLEYCMFDGLNLGVSSGAPVIQEGVSISFDRIVPVQLKSS